MAVAGTLVVEAEMKPNAASMTSFNKQMSGAATKAGNSIKRILSGAIGAAFVASSFKGAKDMEESLRQVSVLSDDVNLDGLRKQAEGLSETLGTTGVDSVNAYYQAISAGFSDDAASKLTTVATDLAAIGAGAGEAINGKEAMNLLTTALNAYGEEAGSAESVSDLLFSTIKYGKTTANELAQSFSTAAPMAAGLGISMSDLLSTSSALTQMGFQTSKAFVGVRQIFKEAAKDSSDVGKAIQENLHMSFIEATESGMSFADIFQNGILPSLDGSNAELINLFKNVRGGSAAMALSNNDMKLLNKTMDGFKKATGSSAAALGKFAGSPITKFEGGMQKIKNTILEMIEGVGGLGNAVTILAAVFAAFKIASFIAKLMEAVAAYSAVAVAKTASQSGVGSVFTVPATVAAIGAGIAAVGAIAGTAIIGAKMAGAGGGSSPTTTSSTPQQPTFHVQVNTNVDSVTGDTSTNVTMHQNDNVKNAFGSATGGS